MYVNDSPTAAVITDLVETLEDGREGFKRVAEKLAEDGQPELAGVMSSFSEGRARLSAELRQEALNRGFEIEESGTTAGAVHRGWIALKDALTGSDPHAVLAAAETGEDHAVQEYERALESEDVPADLRQVIAEQAELVRSVHNQVRNLRDQTQ